MNRIGGLDALLVVRRPAFGRELGGLRAIEIGEGAGGDVALLEGVGPDERLEQPPPDDFEPLLGRRRAPRRLEPPTTLRSRSSASRPRMPPTSTSSACVCGEPPVS